MRLAAFHGSVIHDLFTSALTLAFGAKAFVADLFLCVHLAGFYLKVYCGSSAQFRFDLSLPTFETVRKACETHHLCCALSDMTQPAQPPPTQAQNGFDSIASIAKSVLQNLEDQQDWTALTLYLHQDPRPLIQGLPPRRLYLHPDDQIAALTHERKTGERLHQEPVLEWVLPVHLSERWSLREFAAVFDSIEQVDERVKRIVLATVHNDSTVVYYLIHDGMVKPRQN